LTAPVAPRVDGRPHRLLAPADLSAPARAIWTQIVGSLSVEHFRASDSPLLRSYAEITATADMAARELAKGAVTAGKASPWLNVQERAIRAQATLAMRLRLCPSARTDPRTTAREQAPATLQVVDFSRLRKRK
jgi:phage terminase small subunit